MFSMNGLKVGNYVPNTAIKTDALTSKYTIQGSIGRGKFAVVKKCLNNETGETVAAKFIKKRRKGKSCREEILREVVMLELALAHPRLVDLLEVYETPSELVLVTEYCAGGELFHECVIEESFRESDVVRLLIQILEGLTYLHERNIVHLDLKPQNILFTRPYPEGDIKICDLGFACLVNTGEDIRDIIGTPDYVAPEVLDYEPLNTMTDMWSMGVLAYVMLTACSPFAGENNQETFCNISQVKLDFPEDLFSDISEAAQDFITGLLVKNPRKRLTARQCLEHRWLKSFVDLGEVPSLPSPSDAAFDLSQDLGSTVNYHSKCRENQENIFNGKQSRAMSAGASPDNINGKQTSGGGTTDIINSRQARAMSAGGIPEKEVHVSDEQEKEKEKPLLNNQKCSMSNVEKRRSMEIPIKKLRSDDFSDSVMCDMSCKAVKESANHYESTKTYLVHRDLEVVGDEMSYVGSTTCVTIETEIDSNILHVSPLEQEKYLKTSPD